MNIRATLPMNCAKPVVVELYAADAFRASEYSGDQKEQQRRYAETVRCFTKYDTCQEQQCSKEYEMGHKEGLCYRKKRSDFKVAFLFLEAKILI